VMLLSLTFSRCMHQSIRQAAIVRELFTRPTAQQAACDHAAPTSVEGCAAGVPAGWRNRTLIGIPLAVWMVAPVAMPTCAAANAAQLQNACHFFPRSTAILAYLRGAT
jgi:hypothetical protein